MAPIDRIVLPFHCTLVNSTRRPVANAPAIVFSRSSIHFRVGCYYQRRPGVAFSGGVGGWSRRCFVRARHLVPRDSQANAPPSDAETRQASPGKALPLQSGARFKGRRFLQRRDLGNVVSKLYRSCIVHNTFRCKRSPSGCVFGQVGRLHLTGQRRQVSGLFSLSLACRFFSRERSLCLIK